MIDRPCLCAALAGCLLCGVPGCEHTGREDALAGAVTPGIVKRDVVKGQTTQTEVLEVLGPPDLLTHREGREVWTYDKTTYDFEASSGYFTILIAGTESRRSSSSSRSTMVIIYFDDNEIVEDFRISMVKY